MKKICTKCLIEKDLSEFYNLKKGKHGKTPACKICSNQRCLNYRQNNKDKLIKASLKYGESHRKELKAKSAKYRETNKEKLVEVRAKKYKENKDIYAARNKEYRKNNSEKLSDYMHTPLKTPDIHIPSCDNPLVTEEGWTVTCKTCNTRFLPSKIQVYDRIQAFKGNKKGERNFYCSNSCRQACQVYNFKPQHIDPRSSQYIEKTKKEKARDCQTNHLKELQCDKVGHNYCEKCGDIIDVELHHTQPVGTKDAVSSAGHILLCVGCHVSLHATCS